MPHKRKGLDLSRFDRSSEGGYGLENKESVQDLDSQSGPGSLQGCLNLCQCFPGERQGIA